MDDNKGKGKVYLVGAGPGDPGLLTLRGRELLEQADVVIYDRLASPRLMDFVNPRAEKIYVGKRMGRHLVRQEDINRLIIDKAREGQMVVRLKGGDPFIFGRGGEEAQELKQEGIEFEIVPGVTSAIAVPTYAGIPLTHRAYAASVAFITGHRRMEQEQAPVQWEGLAKGVGTLVFLMGMSNLPTITNKLMEFGRSPDTPVAVIRWGTTPLHQSITGTLENIVQKVKEEGFTPPAIIVVGDVVKVRDEINWFESRPLLGRRVLVTRTRSQASRLIHLLERKGAGCIECPTIEVRPLEDTAAVDNAIERLVTYDWIVFSSANAVKFFFARIDALGLDIRALGSVKIAVVGAATAQAVHDLHLKVDLIPEDFRAEGLVDAFKTLKIEGEKVLIPRAKVARDVLPIGLREMGAEVDIVPLYETVIPEPPPQVVELLQEERVDVVTFTSSSTVDNFMKALPSETIKRVLSQARVACIGPVTAKTARKHGIDVDIIPEQYTIESMVQAIEQDFQRQEAVKGR